MHLTPREQEKLLIVVAADLARRRKDRGIRLNHPEAVAYITAEILEGPAKGALSRISWPTGPPC